VNKILSSLKSSQNHLKKKKTQRKTQMRTEDTNTEGYWANRRMENKREKGSKPPPPAPPKKEEETKRVGR
jgi:hypothetical protein